MNIFPYIRSSYLNIFSNFVGCRLTYISDTANWVINQEAENLVKAFNQMNFRSRISLSPAFLGNQIVHFGSDNIYFSRLGQLNILNSKTVLTWFHVADFQDRLELIKQNQKSLKFIHTSCSGTKKMLLKSGVDNEKIIVIPLGVDTSLFTPASEEEKNKIRKKLNIPQNRFIIGSFQKDGEGWKEGLSPKLIKGPDVFVSAMSKLKKYNPYILLTGPSRGYIKKNLEKIRIEYKHVMAENESQMADCYKALDMYLISSRLEGGPKAIVESLSSGVPLVSTKVGMAEDVIKDGINGFLVDVEDAANLSKKTEILINNQNLRKQLAREGRKSSMKFAYDQITKQYIGKMYKFLI